MTKYIALLRGINVGGKNIIKMTDLKSSFEKIGFKSVSTYIQSGNVLFESSDPDTSSLELKIEKNLSKTFNYSSTVLVRSHSQIKQILSKVPPGWKTRNDLRCYIAFIKDPHTSQSVLEEVEVKKDIDFINSGPGCVYMSILLSGLTKSSFNKLVAKKIYKHITIRNYNTTQKIGLLMDTTE